MRSLATKLIAAGLVLGLFGSVAASAQVSSTDLRANAEAALDAYDAHIADLEAEIARLRARIAELEAPPSPSPTLNPSPSVEPSPSPTSSPSPSPSPIVEPPRDQTQGKQLRFSILCPPVLNSDGSVRKERIDPLVSPGRLSAHFHTFFGARNVTQDRDVALTKSRGTTCQLSGDTGAYWIPVLYRNGTPIDPVQVLVYYRHNGEGRVVPHPQDHGIVANEHQWMCVDSDSFRTPPDCRNRPNNPNGAGLRIIFDSENVSGGSTPRVAFNIRYGTQNLTGANFGRDVNGNVVTGHGDFWNTWHQPTFSTMVSRCLDQTGVWRSYTTAEWEDRCSKVTDRDFARGD